MAALIDFHTHFFSRTFFRELAAHSPLAGDEDEKIARVAHELSLDVPSAAHGEHLQRWLAEMERFGIQHLVSFASVPAEAPVLAECLSLSGGRLSSFAVLDPLASGAPERMRQLLDLGFSGALFFPAMHGYRLDGPELASVLDVLEEDGATAIVHCGMLQVRLRDHFGLPRGYDLSLANPLHLVPAADSHPRTNFVIPHFGAGLFRETLIAGAQCSNIFVDTSSSNSWISTQPAPLRLADVFERALGVFGTKRILFGTDSSVFPRGWRHDLLVSQREALGACGLDAIGKGHILHANAARLLRLEPRIEEPQDSAAIAPQARP